MLATTPAGEKKRESAAENGAVYRSAPRAQRSPPGKAVSRDARLYGGASDDSLDSGPASAPRYASAGRGGRAEMGELRGGRAETPDAQHDVVFSAKGFMHGLEGRLVGHTVLPHSPSLSRPTMNPTRSALDRSRDVPSHSKGGKQGAELWDIAGEDVRRGSRGHSRTNSTSPPKRAAGELLLLY